MAGSVNISKDRIDDFKKISSIEKDILHNLLTQLNDVKEKLIRPRELKNLFIKKLGTDTGKLLFRHLYSLASTRRERKLSAEDIIEDISGALANSDLNEQELENWNAIKAKLIDLLNSNVICAVTKVLELTYDHDHLLDNSRIITDIRPVFDDQKNEILGAIISHNLKLEFFGKEGSKEISISLETSDIESLQKSCEDALKKAEKSKELLEKSCSVKTMIVGDDFYEQ